MTMTTAEFLDVGRTSDWSDGRIPREPEPPDSYGRPLLEPPHGGYLEPYTRSSGFGDTYTDKTNLTEWLIRMAMIGVAIDESLQLAICAHHEERGMMKKFKKQAHDNAEAGAAATRGTAIHKLCDAYDRGDTPYVPPKFAGDVSAYMGLTTGLFDVVEIEQFCVNEEYHCAGTPDRLYRLKRDLPLPAKYAPEKPRRVIPKGTVVIGDLKTGKDLSYNHIKFACQFFLYSGAQRYTTNLDRMYPCKYYDDGLAPGGDRRPWLSDGEQVDQSDGLLLHMPAGSGRIELRPIDLEKGRHVAEFAKLTREERKLKTIGPPIGLPGPDWALEAQAVTTLAALREVWTRCSGAGDMTDELRTCFTTRAGELS